jgi:D-alanyl-D-alanine carboxypeptidase (penicillin-binding protein 5/6)
LDQTIKIDGASCKVDGSSMYLKQNELYSVEDLLYGLMLASGNDAAVALANAVAGSCDSFVKLMNDKAAELNLKNTNYCNPHGLHNKHHSSSAYDLTILCSYAMQNDDFYKIVSRKSKIVTELNSNTSRTIYNKNKFINMLEGADGIKIGYTTDAGRCLCASATKEDRRLICVILNYHNWFNMAVNLLNKYF